MADNSGTGWQTIDVQSTYTPAKDEAHALAFGFHSNRYTLDSLTSNTAAWLYGGADAKVSGFYGKTALQALFAQDTWKFAPQWRATLGMRYEHWRAFDGRRETASASVPYAERSKSAWSPKASVSYRDASHWLFKLSLGKGVRFPTVAELFQGSVAGTAIINNDPKPEARTCLFKGTLRRKRHRDGRSHRQRARLAVRG